MEKRPQNKENKQNAANKGNQQNTAGKPEYPIRINKYLALAGLSTRRGADQLIKSKQVLINGRIAVLGDKVQEKDYVEMRGGKGGKPAPKYVYYAYNKPVGVITHSPQVGEKDILQSVPLKGVFPIGRLDKDSQGLIILTNDGRITDRLLNPAYEHEKEYVVRTVQNLRSNFKERMENGVYIEGYITKKCKVRIMDDKLFTVRLSEGKKHQIRRMVVALFNEVQSLKRTKVMNITLAKLPVGSYRTIEGEELTEFLGMLGLES